MKTYCLRFDDDEEGKKFLHFLKVESARADKTMKAYIIEAVVEKSTRDNKRKDDKVV